MDDERNDQQLTDAPEYECCGGPLDGQKRPCAPGEAIYCAGGRYTRFQNTDHGGSLVLLWLAKP